MQSSSGWRIDGVPLDEVLDQLEQPSVDGQLRPALRADTVVRPLGADLLAWSPVRPEPVALEPSTVTLLPVLDGTATVSELVDDVVAISGMTAQDAESHVKRIVAQLEREGLLVSSRGGLHADEAIAQRGPFGYPVTHCSETASRADGMTSIIVDAGTGPLRIACTRGRTERRLRRAVRDAHRKEAADAPLGFVLHAPTKETPGRLEDRSGLPLCEGTDVDHLVGALLSHLAACQSKPAASIRFRQRALIGQDHAVLLLEPLAVVVPPPDDLLASSSYRLLDRLTVDIDPQGRLDADAAGRRSIESLPGHATSIGAPLTVRAVAVLDPHPGLPTSRSAVAAKIAGSALNGTREQVLDTVVALLEHAHALTVDAESGLRDYLPGDSKFAGQW